MSNVTETETETKTETIPGTPTIKRGPGRPKGSKNKKKTTKKKASNGPRKHFHTKHRDTVINGKSKRAMGRAPFTNEQKFTSLENRLNYTRSEFRKETKSIMDDVSSINNRVDRLDKEFADYKASNKPKMFKQNKEGDWEREVDGNNNLVWKVVSGCSTALAIWFAYLYFA